MLLKQVTIKHDGNVLRKGWECIVLQIERGLEPNLFYCWYEKIGLGEWMNKGQIKINGEKRTNKIKKINPLQTAEDYLIG